MSLNPKIKPLCANLKRLNIGEYLSSEHFDLFCLENNLDEVWNSCWDDTPAQMIIMGPNHSRYEKVFLHLLSSVHNSFSHKFFDVLLPILIDFANWNKYKLDFTKIIQDLKDLDLAKEKVLEFINEYRSITNSKPLEEIRTEIIDEKGTISKVKNYNKVFIVHGHDEAYTNLVARFISDLGLEPIILREQASSSKTIIEKIETYSNEVDFGIVLYTACDVGAKSGDRGNLKNRARQNVVFEHGYLMGKIGRENVCPLVKGEIETPNDISGVVYVSMNEDEGWKLKLARELKSSGYNINTNKLI